MSDVVLQMLLTRSRLRCIPGTWLNFDRHAQLIMCLGHIHFSASPGRGELNAAEYLIV